MDDKFNNKYRIPPARLLNWDYGSHGLYYVTICTKDKANYFGEIKIKPNQDTQIDKTQNIASYQNTQIVETQNIASYQDTQIVETQNIASLQMTVIGEIAYKNWLEIPKHFQFAEVDDFIIMPNHIHGIIFINKPDKTDWQVNKFGSQSQNLASIIRGYKASVKTYATINNIDFTWQPRYYDRVIRDEKEYMNIREYIINNPERWLLKANDNLQM